MVRSQVLYYWRLELIPLRWDTIMLDFLSVLILENAISQSPSEQLNQYFDKMTSIIKW